MENQTVTHLSPETRYRITIERAASSTKGIDGFKVEANGDDLVGVVTDVATLFDQAKILTKSSATGEK